MGHPSRQQRRGLRPLGALLRGNRVVGTWGAATDLFRIAQPLEDLVAPNADPVLDLNLHGAASDLKEFLLRPQTGSRSVAKELFRRVSALRSRSLSHAVPDPLDVESVPIFAILPSDRGHMSRPYFHHVLRGLRT